MLLDHSKVFRNKTGRTTQLMHCRKRSQSLLRKIESHYLEVSRQTRIIVPLSLPKTLKTGN